MCPALLGERLTVCVIAYAVDDWLRVVRKDLFLATGCAEGFVSCFQVHRGGWVHLPVILLSVFCVDGIPACIRFPNSSCVYLFYMFSVVVMCLLLLHIHVYFVEHVMRRLIMDCWFLCTLYVLYVLRLQICQIVRHIHYHTCCILIYIVHLDFCWSAFLLIVVG